MNVKGSRIKGTHIELGIGRMKIRSFENINITTQNFSVIGRGEEG